MDFGAGLGAGDAFSRTTRQIDIFVDSVLGNDNNDGTPNSPLRSFQEAVYRADESYNAGSNNIWLKPGDYDGAYIDDYDMLKIFGTGANPWDVNIIGDANGNSFNSNSDTIHIGGGSDVRLYNMHVTGAEDNGIYAYGLDYLFMDRVISDYNYGSGFYGEDIYKTKIYNSVFQNNDNFGAYVYEGYKVRSVNSHFSDNDNDGIRVDYTDRMELINVVASSNGFDEVEFEGLGGFNADGAEANDVASVLISGGSFTHNNRRGIDVDYVNDLTLLGVNASDNYEDGVEAQGIFGNVLVDGGQFKYNGNDGLSLEGAGFEDLNGGTETNGPSVMVFGGQYFNNDDDGAEITDMYQVSLFGMDARHNYEDGVDVERSHRLLMGGGYMFENYENGLLVNNVYYTQVNDLISKQNDYNGLDHEGGHRLNVIGGIYSENGDWGINSRGQFFEPTASLTGEGNGFDGLQRVDIKFANVRHNDNGVHVGYSYLGKMVGGTYSDNYYNGIVFSNVAHGIFKDLYVNNNGDNGLVFEAGLFMDNLPFTNDDYMHGPNWNRVDFHGGLYNQNGYDGIYIATDRNQGYYQNYIEANVNYVVSRDNGYTGFNIGGLMYDVERGFGYSSDVFLNMQGGYFGHNGYDGIYLLGLDQGPNVGLGLLVANMTDVVAQHNGGYGVIGRGAINGLPGGMSGYAVNGHDGYYSLIQVTRGNYSFNGEDGIRLNVSVFNDLGLPGLNGGVEEFVSLAAFDQVVAVQNGYNGVSVDGFFGDFRNGNDLPRTNDGNNDYPALVEFWGGVFNQNYADGIRLTADFDFEEGPGYDFDFLAARLTQVEASLNGENGLYIFNYGPNYFRGDVEINNGVYNSNQYDGVFIRGLGDIYANHVIVVGNVEDGFHSRNNLDTFISQDSVIFGNGVNVVID